MLLEDYIAVLHRELGRGGNVPVVVTCSSSYVPGGVQDPPAPMRVEVARRPGAVAKVVAAGLNARRADSDGGDPALLLR